MSDKPIFVATHPRACSTAFERVFMTRRDSLQCVHEPFGDAFYYGPERLGSRYENDEQARISSGFSNSTFQTVLDRLDRESAEGKRLFVKDMAYYLFPPHGKPASIAPSLARIERGVGTSAPYTNGTVRARKAPYPYQTKAEVNNPTVIPDGTLRRFHFTFLIRHPRSSIPSYYRCTVPPLDKVTGWHDFMPSEAGYDELRRLFDYLRSIREIGPGIVAQEENGDGRDFNNHLINGHGVNGQGVNGQGMNGQGVNGFHDSNGNGTTSKSSNNIDICVVDADDLLDNPSGIIEAYCKSTGLKYDAEMLDWDSEEDHQQAEEAFEKWSGWHDDAKHSSALKPRTHKKKVPLVEDEDREWTKKFGAKAAKVIRDTVDTNVEDYKYLKQFALKA